jgi:hypothetical protein
VIDAFLEMMLHRTSINPENASNYCVRDSRRPVHPEDAACMITLSACRRGIHEKFIVSEHVDDILFDMTDEIVPVHFVRWCTLGYNEKHDEMIEELASLKFFCKRTGAKRGRRRKHVLMPEPGVAEFRRPAIVKNKTQPIMSSS